MYTDISKDTSEVIVKASRSNVKVKKVVHLYQLVSLIKSRFFRNN